MIIPLLHLMILIRALIGVIILFYDRSFLEASNSLNPKKRPPITPEKTYLTRSVAKRLKFSSLNEIKGGLTLEIESVPAHSSKLKKFSEEKFVFKPNFNPILPKLNLNLGAAEILSECRKCIEDTRAEYDRISSIPKEECTFESVMRPWALNEARFTTECASFLFPGNVSPSAEIREAADEANRIVQEFAIETLMREDLYQVALAVSERERDQLSGEEQQFLKSVMCDFQEHLISAEDRVELKKKRQRIADLGIEFLKNIREYEPKISEISDLKELNYESLLKQIQVIRDRKCEANRGVLTEVLKLRHECAQLLGYPDHAHFRLESRMAQDPQTVFKFLEDLRSKFMPFAIEELEKLRRLKAEELGRDDVEIMSWDYIHYSNILREREYSINEKIIEYFSLIDVVTAMLQIFEEVFGLHFRQVSNAFEKGLVWHEDVDLWEVWNSEEALKEFPEDDEFVGHLYLDLFRRSGKSKTGSSVEIQPGYDLDKTGKNRQFPAVAILTSFAQYSENEPCLLEHSDIVTLFHEFGHAMHNLLARVSFSRFHGFRVVQEFVEVPSQVLENWSWDRDTLIKRLSKHYLRPEETLPEDLADQLVRSRGLNAGLENLFQIFYSLWDLTVHSDKNGKYFIFGAADEVFEKMRREISLIPQPENVWPSASKGHFMKKYETGYYGYLWSEVFSADIFYTIFAPVLHSDPLSAGLQYRRSILRVGGSRDAMESLVELLGREPISEPFLKSFGLIK